MRLQQYSYEERFHVTTRTLILGSRALGR